MVKCSYRTEKKMKTEKGAEEDRGVEDNRNQREQAHILVYILVYFRSLMDL